MVLTILDYLGIRGSGDMTYSTPHGYRVEGAGSAEANGLYVREGEYAGAPLFKKGRLWLLRYRLRSSGALCWFIAHEEVSLHYPYSQPYPCR